MKLIILIIVILNFTQVYSQDKNDLLSDQYVYGDGELSSYSVFDSINNWYELFSLSDIGDVMTINRIAKDGFTPVDTTFGLNKNGTMAMYRIWKEGLLHGNFEVFDTIGNPIYKGKYYKGVRVGTWISYSSKGKIVNKTIYEYNFEDNLIIDPLLDTLSSFEPYLVYDTLRIHYNTDSTKNEFGFSYEDTFSFEINVASLAFNYKKCIRRKRKDYFIREIYNDGLKSDNKQ